jgi:hypothetical protein
MTQAKGQGRTSRFNSGKSPEFIGEYRQCRAGLACSRLFSRAWPAQSPVAGIDGHHSGDHDGLEKGIVPEHGQIHGLEQIAQKQAW